MWDESEGICYGEGLRGWRGGYGGGNGASWQKYPYRLIGAREMDGGGGRAASTSFPILAWQ